MQISQEWLVKQETQVILSNKCFFPLWVHYDQNRHFYREGSVLLSFIKCKYSSSSVLKLKQPNFELLLLPLVSVLTKSRSVLYFDSLLKQSSI